MARAVKRTAAQTSEARQAARAETLRGALPDSRIDTTNSRLSGLRADISAGLSVSILSRSPLGYQQITSLNTAKALTVPATATTALIQCDGAGVRWRDDGTNPTASVGMRMLPGSGISEMMVYAGDLSTIRFIEETASAKLNVSYYA